MLFMSVSHLIGFSPYLQESIITSLCMAKVDLKKNMSKPRFFSPSGMPLNQAFTENIE